jgi:hypothetical protein
VISAQQPDQMFSSLSRAQSWRDASIVWSFQRKIYLNQGFLDCRSHQLEIKTFQNPEQPVLRFRIVFRRWITVEVGLPNWHFMVDLEINQCPWKFTTYILSGFNSLALIWNRNPH